jgi:hypothetical protein
MALPVLANRARMTASTTGTGTWTLSAAATGHQTFADAGLADGDRVRYGAESSDRTEWEVGIGVYASAGPTLTRSVYDSSNGGSAVNFAAAPEVWVDAAKDTFKDSIRVVTDAGAVTVAVDDANIIVVKKTVGASTIVSLPPAATANKPFTIKDGNGDANTNTITVDGDGGETIDGAAGYLITFAYGSVTVYPLPDGTGWFVI